MDKSLRATLDDLWATERARQNKAFLTILEITDKPVDWAYEVWDAVIGNLKHKDNHNRAIAAQVLCNLAKSDPQNRMLKDFEALLAVTKDERFVTARHCMQALWKVGAAGEKQRQLLIDGLDRRYWECLSEKNCSLIRYDIIESMRKIYDAVGDDKVREKARGLIEAEDDPKYRKKYAGLWRTSRQS